MHPIFFYLILFIFSTLLFLFYFPASILMFILRRFGMCGGKMQQIGAGSGDETDIIILLYFFQSLITLLIFAMAILSIIWGSIGIGNLKNDEESGFPLLGQVMPELRKIPGLINKSVEEISPYFDHDYMMENFKTSLNKIQPAYDKKMQRICLQIDSCAPVITAYKEFSIQADEAETYLKGLKSRELNLLARYRVIRREWKQFKVKVGEGIGSCDSDPCLLLNRTVQEQVLLRPLRQLADIDGMLDKISKLNSMKFFGDATEIVEAVNQTASDIFRSLSQHYNDMYGSINTIDINKEFLNRNSEHYSMVPWYELDLLSNYIVPIQILVGMIGAVLILIVIANTFGLLLGPGCIDINQKACKLAFLIAAQLTTIVGTPMCLMVIFIFVFISSNNHKACIDTREGSKSHLFKQLDNKIQNYLKSSYGDRENDTSEIIPLNYSRAFPITKTLMEDCKARGSLSNFYYDVIVADETTFHDAVSLLTPTLNGLVHESVADFLIFSDQTLDELNEFYNNSVMTPPDINPPVFNPDLEVLPEMVIGAWDEPGSVTLYFGEVNQIFLPQLFRRRTGITSAEVRYLVDVLNFKNHEVFNRARIFADTIADVRPLIDQLIDHEKIVKELQDELSKLLLDHYNDHREQVITINMF